jgi:hypothetical protein
MSARGLAGSAADNELEKGRVKPAVVKRYWAGRAPDFYNEREEDRSSSEDSDEDEAEVTAVAPPVIIKAAEDPRLRRLAEVIFLQLVTACNVLCQNKSILAMSYASSSNNMMRVPVPRCSGFPNICLRTTR